MFRGLYTAGWGMMAQSRGMDVISNNLANVSTNGFKKDGLVFQAFPDVLAKRINDTNTPSNPTGRMGNMQLSSDIGEIYTNYAQGQLIATNTPMDMAISGADRAFFAIASKGANGETTTKYTRDGAFVVDGSGYLVTKGGDSVMGENGQIKVGSEDFMVEPDGTIIVNGSTVDKLKITQFQSTTNLRKVGDNLLEAPAEELAEPFSGVIKQGSLEMSNVNTVREMVDMINILRSYETHQKVIQAIDEEMSKSATEVGSIR